MTNSFVRWFSRIVSLTVIAVALVLLANDDVPVGSKGGPYVHYHGLAAWIVTVGFILPFFGLLALTFLRENMLRIKTKDRVLMFFLTLAAVLGGILADRFSS